MFEAIGKFFSDMWSVTTGITGLFGYIFSNILWVLGGLAVGVVVILIIWAILKAPPNWFLCLLIAIVAVAGSLGICALTQNNGSADKEYHYVAGTTIVDPTKYIGIVANGGYNKSYIEAQENDPNCPTAEDKVFDINMVEYKDIVVFYYDYQIGNNPYTINVIFHKTNVGLIQTGCFNVQVDHTTTGWFWWDIRHYFDFTNQMYKGDNFSALTKEVTQRFGIYEELTVEPGYYDVLFEPYDNAIMYPSSIRLKDSPYHREIMSCAAEGCYQVYEQYFQQLDKIGIKCESEELATENMNTFYNTIYEATKANGYTSTLDVTDLVADVQDGVVYKSNRFLNVKYLDNSINNAFASHDIYEDKDKYIEQTKPDTTVTAVANPQLKMTLVNTNNADLSNFDISTYKVQIKMTNNETLAEYFFEFDTMEKLTNGIVRALPFGTYTLEIYSKVLDFGGTVATVTTNKENPNIALNYTYSGNTLNSKFTLSPIQNVDLVTFDITSTPVQIVITHKETGTVYSYVFDTVEEFNSGITQNVLIGDYSYSIVSEGLTFELTSGEFTLSIDSCDCIFYYDYKATYGFNISVIESQTIESSNIIKFSISEGILLDYLPNCVESEVLIYVETTRTVAGGLIQKVNDIMINTSETEIITEKETGKIDTLRFSVVYKTAEGNNIQLFSNILTELTPDSNGNIFIEIYK